MIQTIATWGAKLGWRGQKRWAEELERFQSDSMRRCVGAVKGAGKEKVRIIAGVERMSTYLDGVHISENRKDVPWRPGRQTAWTHRTETP